MYQNPNFNQDKNNSTIPFIDEIESKISKNNDFIPTGDIENDSIIKLNPYNINNKLVTIDNIRNILLSQNIDIPIKNLNNYQLAFVHKSYCLNKNKVDNENTTLIDKPTEA